MDCSDTGVKVGKTVTFDLNGRTLSLANANTGNLNIGAGATLTLKDSTDAEKKGTGSGKIVATHDYASGYGYGIINISAGATFVLESGLIDTVREVPVNKGQFGVMVAKTGKATINGGHIRAGWYAIAGNGNDNVAPGTTIVVNGGILESTADYAIYHPQAGTLTIAGGTVAGAAGGLSINRGSATITGGTVTSEGTGDTGEWGDGTSGQSNAAITVGAEYGDVALAISGDAVITAPDDIPAISVPESDKAQAIAISGGMFSEKPDNAWFADGFIPVENENGTFGVAPGSFSAEIAGEKYLTLKEAFDVTLIADVDCSDTGVKVGKTVTFDLNGRTLSLANIGTGNLNIAAGATLTLVDSTDTEQKGTGSGKIVATHDYATGYGYGIINISAGATFVLESGLIDTVREDPVNKGQFGVMVAETGKATINGGHIRAGWYAIAGNGNDKTEPGTTIIVNGGILESTADYAIYHPQAGTLTIAGGTVAGAAGGLSINRGTATITGGTVTSKGTGDTGEWPDGTSGQGNAAITVGAAYGDVALDISDEATVTAPAGVPAISVPDSANAQAIAISGGTFSEKPDNAWFADGFIPVETEDGTFGVAPGSFAAEIDGVKYLTLTEAVAAGNGKTIKLLTDATDVGNLNALDGTRLTIDLNGHNITFAASRYFQVMGGSLHLTGKGRVEESVPNWGAIMVWGAKEDVADYSTVVVDEDVTLEGWAPLFINNNAGCAYGVKVTMAGTANSVKDIAGAGGHGVYINGSIQKIEGNVPQITLTETSKVTSLGNGIYAAGYAHWMLAGDVSGADALSIKSGTFTITGGDYRGTGSFADPAEAHGNGSENTGAAVTITTNDRYAQAPIVMDISGTPTFTSVNGYAFYEGIAVNGETPAATASRAVIAIQGGDFTGNADLGADIAITTAENPRVISGGTFSKPIPEALCALGYVPVDTPNAEGKYTVEHPLFTKVGVQMADGSYQVYDSMYAACYDTTMIAQEGVTGTIIVLEDIEFSSYFRVLAGQNVTFDLNGHTVTCTGGPGFSYAIDWVCNDDITAKPTVTITDSSIGQTGVLRSDGSYLDGLVRMVGGKLNITGGRFVQDVDNPNAQYKDNITVLTEGLTVDPEPGRTVEFSGGTIRVESNAATSVQNFGTAIKGGLFHSSEGRPAIEVAHVTQGLVVSGGSFEGDGKAILISAPATITISGGDFTDDIVAIENAGATVKLSGGVFENAVFTGPGTLDVNPAINDLSMASVDTSLGKLMLAGDLDIGTNRLPNTTVEISASATVSMDAVEKELEIGKVNVFSAGDQMEAPQNLTLTVGNLLATQTLVEPTISVENDTIVLTFLAVPTELVGSEAFLAYLRQEDLGSIVSVTGTTKGGTVALTATELNEALSVFRLTNDLFTLGDTDGGKTLVVDYDFGITDVRVQRDTGDLVVTVAVQNAAAEPLAFADGVTFSLCNGEAALEATPATVDGVTTLTVPAAKLPAGALELSVSVAPAAEAETPAE